MQNLFDNDILDFLKLLEKHEVDFLLVGDYAVILHGHVRSTIWIYG
jgi:hypothetical protein